MLATCSFSAQPSASSVLLNKVNVANGWMDGRTDSGGQVFKRIRGAVKLDLHPGLRSEIGTKINIGSTWEVFRHISSQVSIFCSLFTPP